MLLNTLIILYKKIKQAMFTLDQKFLHLWKDFTSHGSNIYI